MSSKQYYYFPPYQPQFYFPKNRFNTFIKYYNAYSLKSRIIWNFFLHIPGLKKIFIINEEALPTEIKMLNKSIDFTGFDVFYNKGTIGPEQKTTAIAFNKCKRIFIKYGDTPLAKELIKNEANSIKKLSKNYNYFPKLLNYQNLNGYSYFTTTVIDGEKLNTTMLTKEIIDFLLTFQVNNSNKGLHKIFSHGDFCPWNLIIGRNGEVIPIDWEMSGNKSLGYDLFTFIFHTNFLLNPKKGIDKILSDNIQWIEQYFDYYKINDYKKYLHSFASQRAVKESGNQTKKLHNKYIKLVKFCE